ncbi:MAG TPA: putative Ig domain-containing protein [Tepidisphaeraceae bacterium]|nr:putative Ig domain-containing protein [Tepidisphaeraceae bacterium]
MAGGQQSATFNVGVIASDQDESPTVTALLAGDSFTAELPITGVRPIKLTFSDTAVQAGTWLDGEIELNRPTVPTSIRLNVASKSPDVRVPASITIRPGQTRVPFKVYVDARAGQQQNAAVSVQFGETSVTQSLFVMPIRTPVLSVPGELAVRANQEVAFVVSAVDPGGLPVVYSADNLPPGAVFNATTGGFSWTPAGNQQGAYNLKFTATNSAKAAAAASVQIAVDPARPVLTGVRNAARRTGPACSPGSLASAEGRWFSASRATMAASATTEVNGARVKVNGAYANVVAVSPERVDFVCPALASGTALNISVESNTETSDSVTAAMAEMAPGLFSADATGGGQGIVYLTNTSLLATSRDYRALGQPAQPGDSLSIRATGVGRDSLSPIVTVGGLVATVDSVQPVAGLPGVVDITITVPPGVQPGDSVPVAASLQRAGSTTPGSAGHVNTKTRVHSNVVTVAIENGPQ